MNWWYLPVILLDVYLLLSVGPWIVLQIIQWVMGQPGRSVSDGGARLSTLVEARGAHTAWWPRAPRLGRYYDPDALALASLSDLNRVLAETDQVWPGLAAYSPFEPKFVDVLALRCLDPMLKAVVAWRDTNKLRRLLNDGEQSLAVLQEQQQVVESIPDQVRARLKAARAEANRLTALLEVEQEAGTQDLEDMQEQVNGVITRIEYALDLLSGSVGDDMPRAVAEVDEIIAKITPTLSDVDQLLKRTAEERSRAQGIAERVASSIRLASERWTSLQSRGACEPAIEASLAALRQEGERLTGFLQQRTPAAYHQMAVGAEGFDAEFARSLSDMDTLEEAMQSSREAMEGSVQALAQVQADCEQLASADASLEPDVSLALVAKATELYAQAEQQRAQGTLQSFRAALDTARVARERLAEAQLSVQDFPVSVQRVQELLTELMTETLSDWRSRALRMREELSVYQVHWEGGLAGSLGEAVAHLDEVDVDLERISPNIRYRRRFRQSELPEALQILTHARASMTSGRELVVKLEEEHNRLTALRAQFEEALQTLQKQTLPALVRLRGSMMEELGRRLTRFEEKASQEIALYSQPAQVNYDYAIKEWLPAITREAEAIQAEHERTVREYRDSVNDAVRRIDRAWARLAKLNPEELPGPEEKVKPLAAELDAWRADIEREAENPPALHELLRVAARLEERVDLACRQIQDGRRNLENVRRQYQRHVQDIERLHRAIEELCRNSTWSRLIWENEAAQQMWEEARSLEQTAQGAQVLTEATNQMQRAVNMAQQAEQHYERVERQIASAIRRLDEEHRSVQNNIRRAEREAETLRQEGSLDELRSLEETLSNARHAIDLARGATTFEDALRHLRAGAGELAVR
jgi:hypothetical protein